MTKVLLEEPADAGVKPRVVELENVAVAEPNRVALLVLALGVDGWAIAIANAISDRPTVSRQRHPTEKDERGVPHE